MYCKDLTDFRENPNIFGSKSKFLFISYEFSSSSSLESIAFSNSWMYYQILSSAYVTCKSILSLL